METILWSLQIFLALICVYSGISKSFLSEEQLVHNRKQTGVEGLPLPLIRFIGICQLLGAAGLILPGLLNIYPILTSIAAFAFAIDITMGSGIHIQRKEYKTAVATLSLALITFFVAAARFYLLKII